MSKYDKSTKLEPHLRFPKFRNAAGWDVERLGSRGDFLSSLTGKSAADFDTGDATFIPYMNVFSNTFTDLHDLRAVNVGNEETQNAVARGDVFFTVSSETPEDAGMSSVLLGDIENCYLNSFCALFRFHEGRSPDPDFLGYSLRSGVVRKHLARGAQGATRYNISKGVFRDVPLLLPDPAEQRKIAECLGSLDDWIAAETEGLAALRRHKTGLLQQLFPRPSETRPRLRFPEFTDAPEWERGAAVDAINTVSPPKKIQTSQYADNGLYPIIDQSLEPICGWTSDPEAVIADPLPAIIFGDHTCVLKITNRPFAQGADGIKIINGRNGYETTFLYQLLSSRPLKTESYKRHFTQLKTVEVALPPTMAEQRKIAECLGSLDDWVAAETESLAALRRHKRGLMQQLFPLAGNRTGQPLD